ncbi:MAG: GspH/FimT family pseudopilin [Proteobacteria bacterium]|nr:GspH/FimT family pseudopilin [Pseudomonadota bacterium]
MRLRLRLRSPAARHVRRGFTLIELLTVVTVLVVLMMVAVPAFDSVRLSTRLNAYANSLMSASQFARSEAIKRNAAVTLCASADGATCATNGQWEAGWIVLSGTTLLRAQPGAAGGYQIRDSGSLSSLSYDGTGLGVNQATLTICRATPTVGSQERVVKISATGRTSVTSTTTGICS